MVVASLVFTSSTGLVTAGISIYTESANWDAAISVSPITTIDSEGLIHNLHDGNPLVLEGMLFSASNNPGESSHRPSTYLRSYADLTIALPEFVLHVRGNYTDWFGSDRSVTERVAAHQGELILSDFTAITANLAPAPEPCSAGLSFLGLALIAARRRR
jgi:MYXO-CTERM domain-containing protein